MSGPTEMISTDTSGKSADQPTRDKSPNDRLGLSVRHLTARYAGASAQALDHVTLDVPPGAFVTLLGPSGSGKTTLLRVLAGLFSPASGEVSIGGRVVYSSELGIDVPTRRREVGMVFQSYALWPHMTIAANVAYPLRIRKWRREAISQRVKELLGLVGLGKLGERYPSQLSGGQQQRVALARSISHKPSLLLMDEPLSNLDAELRSEMRAYIKAFQRDVGVTTVYVTHDREEALALSDLVALVKDGEIVEYGEPRELFTNPRTRFGAQFFRGCSLLNVHVTVGEAGLQVTEISSGSTSPLMIAGARPGPWIVAVRPQDVTIIPAHTRPVPQLDFALPATIVASEFLGDRWRVEAKITEGGPNVFALVDLVGILDTPPAPGVRVKVGFADTRWFERLDDSNSTADVPRNPVG